MLDEIDLSAMRSALMARKHELEELEKAGEESRYAASMDHTSVGRLSRLDALQGHEMVLATQRLRHAERARIDAALKRIEQGTYGDCLSCGEPIPAARLHLDPAAAQCVRCAEAARHGKH